MITKLFLPVHLNPKSVSQSVLIATLKQRFIRGLKESIVIFTFVREHVIMTLCASYLWILFGYRKSDWFSKHYYKLIF
jgi:hypothetical protein